MTTIDPNLPPVIPGTTSPASNTSSPSSTTTTQTGGPTDTISNAASPQTTSASTLNPVLPLPNLTIKEFATIVNSAIDQSHLQTWQQQQDTAVSFNGFYQSSLQQALTSISLYRAILTISSQMANIYNNDTANTNNLNNAINNFNSTIYPQDQNAINTLNQAAAVYNQAVADFNAGHITQAQYNAALTTYNAAITSYNNYLLARNSSSGLTNTLNSITSFNDNANTTNQEITAVNNEVAGTRIPLLTPQSAYSGNLNMPGPSIPTNPPTAVNPLAVPPPLPAAVNTIQPPITNAQIYLQSIYAPFANSLLAQFLINKAFLQTYTNLNDFLQFIYQDNAPIVSAAFTSQLPQVFIGGSGANTASTGAGVSLGTMIATLNNPQLSGILDQGIFSADTAAVSNPLSPEIRNELQFFNIQFLQQIGLFAGLEAIGRLGAGSQAAALAEGNSNTLKVLLGLSFADQVNSAIASGSIKEAIQNILSQAFPNTPANNLTDLANQLTSASELTFLGVAISQVAQAIGNPQLFGQIIASSGNPSNLATLNANQALSISDVLSNNISVANLKNVLTNNLVAKNSTIGLQNAQSIVNASVNSALSQNQITSTQQLQSAIHDALIKNGISESDAAAAALLALNFTQAEANSNYLLDTGINISTLNHDTLVHGLTSQNISSDIANSAVTSALSGQQETSLRNLRDRLSNSLNSLGIPLGNALLASTSVLAGTSPTPSISPQPLSALQQQLGTNVFNLLNKEIGNEQAVKIASQLVNVISGSEHSLRQQLNGQLTNLRNQQNIATSTAADDYLRTFNKPNLNLYVFNQQLMDPANNLIHSMWTGIMYSRPLPSNFQHPSDIPV